MTVLTLQLHAPHEAQQQVLDEARRFNVLACGRRWGKTDLAMDSLALPTALDGMPVGWFAPTYKILGDAWESCIDKMRSMGGRVRVNKQERRIEFPNDGLIEFWSTEPSFAGQEDSDVGRSRHYKRVIYDEAARARRLQADWTKAIMPTLADLKGDAWFPSTPKGMNYFHQLFLRGQSDDPNWKSWCMPTSTNPLIDPEEIENASKELPRDAFEQEYLAKFLANAANPFGIDAIRAAQMVTMGEGPVVVWGVDLAKSHDWTVAIGLNESGEVCAFQRYQKDWRATRAHVAAMLKSTPALVDSTGVGDPIVEDLQAQCGNVEGFKFTSQSKQRIMEGLALAIQNQRVRFPVGPIVNELESFMYEYRPSGVRYTAPEGLHDDCVCALALAVECSRTHVPGRISIGDRATEFTQEEEDAWSEPFENDRMWSATG